MPALAILNIDNFALVNDFYGHETGDKIIIDFGTELLNIIEECNFSLYHLQGDEYVIFNSNMQSDGFLEKIYQSISKLSKVSLSVGDESLSFNFSIGVSFENKEKILTTADMALKVAKEEKETW